MAPSLVLGFTDTPGPRDLNLISLAYLATDTQQSRSGASAPTVSWQIRDGTLTLPLLIRPPSSNWNALAQMLEEAKYGAAQQGLSGCNLVLRQRLVGETQTTYIDITDGYMGFNDASRPSGDIMGAAILVANPVGRGLPYTVGPSYVTNGDRCAAGCITRSGSGTATFSFGGQTTAPIAMNAATTAATIQAALQGLSSIGSGNLVVTGPAGGTFSYLFVFTMANLNQATITTNGGTGGAVVTVAATSSSAVWIDGIPGVYPAAARVRITDTSSPNMVRCRVGQHAHSQLQPADVYPVFGVTYQPPATLVADATGRRGSVPQLTCSSAWQSIARYVSPAAGKFNGRKRIYGNFKSSQMAPGWSNNRPGGNLTGTPVAGGGALGTMEILATVVPYDGTAPYVAGTNHLGPPSAWVENSLTLLTQGGTQQVALTPLFYDDFELGNLSRWFPGIGTIIGASSVTVLAAAKDTGIYGCRLVASGVGSLAALIENAPPLPASKVLSAHTRFRVTATPASGLRVIAKMPAPPPVTVQAPSGNPVYVSTISGTGGSSFPVTMTTIGAHGLATGDVVRISGTQYSFTTGYPQTVDGTFTVTVLSSTTFQIPVTESGASTIYPSAGTVQKIVNVTTTYQQAFGLGTPDGTNWGMYASSSVSGSGGLTLVGGATTTLAAGFHDVELTVDQSSGVDTVVRVTVDGLPLGGVSVAGTTAIVGAPAGYTLPSTFVDLRNVAEFGVQAFGTGATETTDIDNFSISDGYIGTGASVSGYAMIYAFDPPVNAGGLLLKYQIGGDVWSSIDVGNVNTYTLRSALPNGVVMNSPPPTTPPALQPVQVRALVAAQGTQPALVPVGAPYQLTREANHWELADLGAANCPPSATRQGGTPEPYLIEFQARCLGGTPTVRMDFGAVFDEDRDRATLSAPWLTTNVEWDFDTRADDESGVMLRNESDESSFSEAAANGSLRIGPGGTWLTILQEINDGGMPAGDAAVGQAAVYTTITPLYDLTAGI